MASPRTIYRRREQLDSAADHFEVVPSDTVDFETPVRGFYIGQGGHVVIKSWSGLATYRNVPTGTVLPVYGVRVNATGTTALFIVGLV